MAHLNILGMGVALITPFTQNKEIDYPALKRVIDHVMDNGADFLVVLGTTGETPALSIHEKKAIKNFVKEKTEGKIPLVLGLGGNNTAEIVRELTEDDLSGYSAILSVVPPYNKPSQEGIFCHFKAIAEASPIPLILYNVPGRTGVNMTADTTLRLAREIPGIIGIKEASGDIHQIQRLLREKPEDFTVLSGDDGMTYPLMTLGAQGVISVLGNAYPKEFSEMVHLCLEGNYIEAVDYHYKFREIIRLLFTDGNPAGVKCVMHDMGLIENELRLPLVPVSENTASEILHWVKILK
ncbi:MAG: 4-hydroxy-tetrahydrodipicolinate synthase [Muribaculaceae bacterium]|nr:4-hydroxy-tetrahydrodipicolinate synthase [Muribaculaceae bacterium]MDE6522719.1 4-hydroxy-tetrahydrodipicolinate synthase [Muribaculaceae bacterium]